MIFQNTSKSLVCFYVEPWGSDYWVKPNETFRICPIDADDELDFHLVCAGDSEFQIYVSGTNEVIVLQDEVKLECGHQRPGD